MPFDREQITKRRRRLQPSGRTSARRVGSTKDGLTNFVRYEYRGKVAKTQFERDWLIEYTEVFKMVCVDAVYYTFPRPEYL